MKKVEVKERVEAFRKRAFLSILRAKEMSKDYPGFLDLAIGLYESRRVFIPYDEKLETYLKNFKFIKTLDVDTTQETHGVIGCVTLSMEMDDYLNSSLYSKVKNARLRTIKEKLSDLSDIQNSLTAEYINLA